MKMFGLILMILAVASAQVIRDGACPVLQPVQNFDISAYAGRWYHYKNIPVINEANGKCESAFYTLHGDSLKLKYSQVENGIETYVEGELSKAHDANTEGRLLVKIDVETAPVLQPLSILSTDYSTYSLSYYCTYDEISNTHRLYLWLLTRSKGLNCKSKASVDAIISNYFGYIDPSKFNVVEVSEEACRYHTSRVYNPHHRY